MDDATEGIRQDTLTTYKDAMIKIRQDLEEQYNLKELLPRIDRLRQYIRALEEMTSYEPPPENIILKPGDMTD